MVCRVSAALFRVVRVTEKSRRPLAVFDLDGALADSAHRQRFLERKPRDWDAFFAAAPQDPPLAGGGDPGVARRGGVRGGLSDRPCRALPPRHRRVAGRAGLPAGRVWMRRDDDRRPARHAKLDVLRRLARDREIHVLVDDDELVCDEAERAGFRVVRARWATASAALKDAQEREETASRRT